MTEKEAIKLLREYVALKQEAWMSSPEGRMCNERFTAAINVLTKLVIECKEKV